MKVVAKREIIAVKKNSTERRKIVIEIFLPYPVDDGKNYFCHAHFSGIENESYKVGGIDSLQALTLAILKTKKRFQELQKEQYDFFWPENNSPMESFDYSIETNNEAR